MKRLRFRLILAIGFLIVVFTSLLLCRAHRNETKHMELLFNQQLGLALDFDLAIRQYVAEKIRPLMYDVLPEGEFIPYAMSTSFASREIFKKVREEFSDVSIKFSSNNPKNPENLAGPDESEIIKYFNENPTTDELTRNISMNGIQYLANVKAMRMEESCLKCHGDPADAPRKLLEIYGSEKGFHWQVGNVIGLDTVAIPLSVYNTSLSRESRQAFTSVGIGIALLFLAIVLVMRFMMSDRKIAEARIAQSEEKYRTILESIEDGYYEVDLSGNLIFFNDSICRILGYSRSELTGMNNRSFMCDKTSQDVYRMFNRVFTTGEPAKGLDLAVIHKNGTKRYINISITLMKGKEKTMSGFRGVVRDVTDQRQAEEALKMSEEKFRILSETSVDAIFQLNKNGDIIYASPSVLKISGYAPEETLGTHFTLYFAASQIPLALELFDRILSGETVRSQDLISTRKDGKQINIEVTFTPLRQNGRIIGAQGTLRDITERVRLEKKIKESEEKFRLLTEAISDAIFEVNPQGVFTYVSPGTSVMTGYSIGEIIGKNAGDFASDSDKSIVDEAVKRVFSGEPPQPIELVARKKDGESIYIEIRAIAYRREGKIESIFGIARDITQRKMAEQAIRESEQNLRSMFNAITESVLWVDPDGVILALNMTAAQRLRSEADQMVGKNAFDFLAPEVANPRKEKLTQVARTGRPMQFEDVRYGRHVWTNYYPVFDDTGKVSRIAVFTMDIHDRKMAESELAKFKKISDLANYGTGIFTMDGRLIYVNKTFANLHGYEPEELADQYLTVFHTEDQMAHVKDMRKRLFTEGGFVGEEVWHKRKDGSVFPMLMNAFVIKNENDGSELLTVTAIDITAMNQAEASLRESEEKYRLIFDASPLGIFHYDKNGVITDCNPKTWEIAGSEREAIVGFNLISRLKEKAFLNAIEESLKGKISMLEGKYRSVTGGKESYLKAYYAPVMAHDEIIGGICVSEDISERVKAETQLKESHEKLHQLTKHLQSARESERASIARELHDELGQVLTAINMEAAWVTNKIPEDLESLKHRAETISDLVLGAIAAVKRIISELRPTLLSDLGLGAAIVWQAQEYEKRLGFQIDVRIDPEEFDVDEDLGLAIFRIFQEGTTNVIRHSKATRVGIHLEKSEAFITMVIKDNGIGISEENLTKNESFGVLGMRERAEVFDGTIEIKGEPGKGTTLKVKFPV